MRASIHKDKGIFESFGEIDLHTSGIPESRVVGGRLQDGAKRCHEGHMRGREASDAAITYIRDFGRLRKTGAGKGRVDFVGFN